MKIIIYCFLFLFTNSVFAQQQDCNCSKALENLIKKVENEYPGFTSKTEDQLAYIHFKEKLLQDTKKTSDDNCPTVLKTYTDFFKDPHLWVGRDGVPFSKANILKSTAIELDIVTFKKNIASSKDPYEGIWSNESYTLGVKKTNTDEYTGFIISSKYKEWKANDIKFKLLADNRFDYALLDRSIKTGDYKFVEKSILFLEDVGVVLVKQTPKPVLTQQQITEKLNELEGFYFKALTPKTAVIKMPSFEYHNLRKIDSLITNNKKLLEKENLIIDLRGNPGGTTDAYQKLLPYISGKFILTSGVEFLATQTYIDNLEAYKKTLDKNTSTEAIDNNIKILRDNLGKFVDFSKLGSKKSHLEEIKIADKRPRQVIIFANGQTGSSAEYFLFIAKQSKNVKIFGKPSYGALDYGNAYLIDLKCSGYQLLLPTYRALRLPHYPIDNIGIQPDIYMDNSIEDWTKFALDYLEH